MIEQYKKELKELKIKMIEAEMFAKKMPIFKNYIIENKITESKDCVNFGDQYKNIPLRWGIARCLYKTGEREITNYPEEKYSVFLFCIYINSCSLFDCHNRYGIEKILEKTQIFFYDQINSTIYCTDDQIEALLEQLNIWYLGAIEENKIMTAKNKIKKAQEVIEIQNKILEGRK
jgi:hypothetical protein